MFSKRADPAQPPLKHWSITTRLAFLYTLSALVTLVSVALFLCWSLRDTMMREESDFLSERLRVYRSILENQPSHLDIIRNDIDWEGAYADLPEYYTRVLTDSGRILLETPGMIRAVPVESFLPAVTRGRGAGAPPLRYSRNGRSYLLNAVTVEAYGGEGKRTLQLAVDITNGDHVIAEKERMIVVLFLLGILAATGVGIIVARKALSPIKEITAVAEQITAARIATRTDPGSWPEELRSFAVAFNGMLGRLEESFTRLSQLSSNLAHELRTPINNLLVETGVILGKERSAEEYRRTIESGMEEFQRLSRIIDSLLFLARAENPATPISPEWLDATEVATKVCSFFEAMAEEYGAVITVAGSGRLYGDGLMFERALGNLLANSLYYSPPGGRIGVVLDQARDGSLAVTVTDTGYGIDDKDLSRIFDRFYRGEKTWANHPAGSGLGLAIVKSVMDLHSGTIDITSTPGKGTSVTLHFPPPPRKFPSP